VPALYLEWFSRANGRVVVESARFRIELGEQAWRLSEEDERRQREHNQASMEQWMQDLAAAGDAAPYDPAADAPMDEFQWEKFMRASDARADQYGALLEKFMDHPDRDRIIARAMGWDWMEEALDEQARARADAHKGPETEEDPPADGPALEPDPQTEGVDWVRNEHGHPEHPLVLRARQQAVGMWKHAEARGWLAEKADADLRELICEAEAAGAKMAGALNHLAYRDDTGGGFVVANLKRALGHLHRALSAAEKVAGKGLLEPDWLQAAQRDLFAIREDVLALMQRFRGKR
jgi:hypothetical protein